MDKFCWDQHYTYLIQELYCTQQRPQKDHLARLHDAEIGFRDRAAKDGEADTNKGGRILRDFTWRLLIYLEN